MNDVDDLVRQGLASLHGRGLDPAAIRAAKERATAAAPSRTRASRVLGVTAAVFGAGAIVAVLAVLVVSVPKDPPEAAPPAPAPPLTTYPDTPDGRQRVTTFFESFSGNKPSTRIRLASVRAESVFTTAKGQYTIWTAERVDGRSRAVVISSPRLGASATVRRGPAPTPARGVELVFSSWSPGAGAREYSGVTAKPVTKVEAILRNGTRADAHVDGGWFVFTQDYGHAAPRSLVAFDANGHRVGQALVLGPGGPASVTLDRRRSTEHCPTRQVRRVLLVSGQRCDR